MLDIFIGTLVVGWLLYKWWTYPYTYWKRKGFPYLPATFPYGSNANMVKMDLYLGYMLKKVYQQVGEKPYAGVITLRRPQLFLKDPEIIKAVMLKDFVHFTDRINVDNIKEPISHHLFNLGGDKWKAFRVKMTPTFTSGKLKLMFPYFEACSKSLVDFLDSQLPSNSVVDVKNVMGRYTTKIVGACAYGIDIDSMGDENNAFVKIVQNIFDNKVPFYRFIQISIQAIIPGIEKIFKFRFVPQHVEDFLTSVVLDTMQQREKSGFKRNDFIDLMMEVKAQGEITIDSVENKGKATVDISESDVVAQVFVFLAAGFETSSSVTSYCLYELAVNQDIQEKLREEISAAQPLSYQNLQEMRYLDMVVHETMRKYPTLPILTRKCVKPYRMADGTVLERGVRIIIPVYALHHDPQYYPDPDKFDPERFTPENKNSRPQFCYLPFGEGPRLCIGMRFGLLQTKMGIATILSKYRVVTTPQTVSPLEFTPTPLISTVWHPIHLSFQPL